MPGAQSRRRTHSGHSLYVPQTSAFSPGADRWRAILNETENHFRKSNIHMSRLNTFNHSRASGARSIASGVSLNTQCSRLLEYHVFATPPIDRPAKPRQTKEKPAFRWPVPRLACGLPDDDTGKRDLPVQGFPERLLGSLMRLYRRLRQWLFKTVGPDGLVATVANRMVTRCDRRTLWPEIRQGRISRQACPKLPRSGSSDSRSERSAMARGANSQSRASILHRRTADGRRPTSLNRPRHGQAAAWPKGRTPARGLPLGGRLFATLSVAACRPGHPGPQERDEPHFNISHFIHPGVCSDDGRCHRAICDCPHSNTSVLPNG